MSAIAGFTVARMVSALANSIRIGKPEGVLEISAVAVIVVPAVAADGVAVNDEMTIGFTVTVAVFDVPP